MTPSDKSEGTGVRLPPLPSSQLTDDQRAVLGHLLQRETLDNVWATFVRHPALFRQFSKLGIHILRGSTLSPRAREVAIIRVGYRKRCAYEVAQHLQVGRAAGLSDQEMDNLCRPDAPGDWCPSERLVITATDELVNGEKITDETWQELASAFSTEQMMDLVFTVGTYNTVSWALNSFGTPLDKHLVVPLWLRPSTQQPSETAPSPASQP